MRPALSDYSTMPTWPTWALVVGVIIALAAITSLFCGPLVHRAPLHDEDVSYLDALDGVGHCTVVFCDEPVQVQIHAGHDYWPFCIEHGLPYLTDGMRDDQEAAS